MGKVSILTQTQKTVLTEIAKDKSLTEKYYFTGGTALSEFYLQHRESVDLDLFSEDYVNPEVDRVFVDDLKKKYRLEVNFQYIDPVRIYMMEFPNGEKLKVDFSWYNCRRLEKGKLWQGLEIDSEIDIAVNKLSSVMRRNEIKDFVDLYFLLKKYSFWDLREGVRRKFNTDFEPYMVSGAFLRIDDHQELPKMFKKVGLDAIKKFFRSEGKKLAGTVVEK